jgi:hypothetical protein
VISSGADFPRRRASLPPWSRCAPARLSAAFAPARVARFPAANALCLVGLGVLSRSYSLGTRRATFVGAIKIDFDVFGR